MSSSHKPIDDDVDDLDDVLDDFAAPAPAPPTSTAPKPTVAGAEPVWGPAGATPAVDDEFAAQLAAGMEALMRELGAPGAPVPGAGGGPAPPQTAAERAQAEKLAAAWEAMLVEGMDAASASGSGAGASAGTDTAATAAPAAGAGTEHEEPADAFQKTIREAMARMQDNEAGLRADAQTNAADPVAALLASLGEGAGGEGDEELAGVLEGMMGELMAKDVLYEPLKELNEKFPAYLQEHAATLSDADKARYAAQQDCVRRITAVFEDPAYSDTDAAVSAKVVALMNEMQTHGSPPPELMGPLPAGFDVGPDGLPQMPEGCTLM